METALLVAFGAVFCAALSKSKELSSTEVEEAKARAAREAAEEARRSTPQYAERLKTMKLSAKKKAELDVDTAKEQAEWELANEKRIDGDLISNAIRADVKKAAGELKESHQVTPGLAVVLVGQRTDSATYVRMKKQRASEVGFHSVDKAFPESVSQEELLECIEELNNDSLVHGILVQLPLPKHIDEPSILKAIKLEKDADGFSATNIGNMVMKGGDTPLALPCTPAGCIELLKRSGVTISGKMAVVLGRSDIVGMPVSQLLQAENATVCVVHSRTKDPATIIRTADIVVAAIGQTEYVRGDWLKPGCVVIDVGMNQKPDPSKKSGSRNVGDVNYDEALPIVSAITPVPGGVGPMTIAMLLKNTVNLARHSCGLGPIA